MGKNKMHEELEKILNELTDYFATMDELECKKYILNIKKDETICNVIKPYIVSIYLEAYKSSKNKLQ